MKVNQKLILGLIIFFAFIIRLWPLDYPFFTTEEARIAYRGHALATEGKDELGRNFPLLFNSLDDYQLPATSYVTVFGELIFGKSEFGARLPFILVGVLIVFIIYKISEVFNEKWKFRIFVTLIAAFSPGLIFFSKVPNEIILVVFSYVLLFYYLTRKKMNILFFVVLVFFSLSTSKLTWWTLVPFISITLYFFQQNLSYWTKLNFIIVCFLAVATVIILFFQVPNSSRSLLDNDFSLFQDSGLITILNRLRGQGLESGWPPLLERLLFNKLQIASLAFLNWLSQIQPSILFGQFDETGKTGFVSMGMFTKSLLIPFITGLIFLMKKEQKKFAKILLFLIVVSFPALFNYTGNNKNIVVTALPIFIIILAIGLVNLKRVLRYLLIALMILEVLINITYPSVDIKNSSMFRPLWVKTLAEDSYNFSQKHNVAISDNLISDIIPYLLWYSPHPINNEFKDFNPYRFHQIELGNIRIIGSNDAFYNCGLDAPTYVIASNEDLARIVKWLNLEANNIVEKKYKDDFGNVIAYQLQPKICVH